VHAVQIEKKFESRFLSLCF